MNHIYKVVFCKSTNTFVAVAEYARAHGKGGVGSVGSSAGSSKFAKTLALSALSATIMLINGTAFAASATSSTTGIGLHPSGIGTTQATANHQTDIAIGLGAIANGNAANSVSSSGNAGYTSNQILRSGDNIAIGVNAKAIGGTNSSAASSIAIGRDTFAETQGSVAVGGESVAGGVISGGQFNNHVFNGSSGGDNTPYGQQIAVGSRVQAYGDQSTAIGNNTLAAGNSSIAIGGDDITKVNNASFTAKINSKTNDTTKTGRALFQDLTGTDIASVSAGTVAGESSIAIGTMASAGGSMLAGKVPQSATSGSANEPKREGVYDIAIGTSSRAVGFSSTAIGTGAKAINDAALSIGANAHAFGVSSTAIGVSSSAAGFRSVATGANSHALHDNSVAIGSNATVGYYHANAGANAGIEKLINAANGVRDGNPEQVYNALATVWNAMSAEEKQALSNAGFTASVVEGNIVNTLNKARESGATTYSTQQHFKSLMLPDARENTRGGINGVAVGNNSKSISNHSVAIGDGAENTGKVGGTIGWGLNDTGSFVRKAAGGETGEGQIAIGQGAKTTFSTINGVTAGGEHAIAIGTGALTEQMQDIAVGAGSVVTRAKNAAGTILLAEGDNDNARNAIKNGSGRPASVAVGAQSKSGGTHGDTIIGAGASSLENKTSAIAQATAIGSRAMVYGDQALAIGADTRAIGNSSVAIGGDDINKAIDALKAVDTSITGIADLDNIRGLITNTEAQALVNTNAQFPNTSSVGDASVAIGAASQTLGIASVATGANALAYGNGSIAMGLLARSGNETTPANAIHTIAIGTHATATGSQSIAMGTGANALRGATNAASNQVVIGTSANSTVTDQVVVGHNAVGGTHTASVVIGKGAKGDTVSSNAGSRHTNYFNPFTPILAGNASDKALVANSVDTVVTGESATPDIVGSSIAVGEDAEAIGGGVAIGDTARVVRNAGANRALGIAIGSNAFSNGGGVVLGASASAENINAISIGRQAVAKGSTSQAIGVASASVGERSIALGQSATSIGVQSVAIGGSTSNERYSEDSAVRSEGKSSLAIGTTARVGDNLQTLARGANETVAAWNARIATEVERVGKLTENSVAIGTGATVTGRTKSDVSATSTTADNTAKDSIAIGTGATVKGNQSIAIGVGNQVLADNSGAFGDPSIVAGTASYTFGNDNVVGSATTGAFVLGNNNQMGATPSYQGDTKKVDNTKALTGEVNASNSVAIGNENKVTTTDTFILGSGINVGADGKTAQSGTVANSVYLGKDSTAVSATGFNKTSADVNGTTTTGGATGTVNDAVVGAMTYGGFAGSASKGAVTVGSAGDERRIMNVAAGQISATSTDAINGSQLYSVINNTGFNLQGGGQQKDFVTNGDIVNFVNGKGTQAVVTNVSPTNNTVTFNADYSNLTVTSGGTPVNITGNVNDGFKLDLPATTSTGAAPQNYFHVNSSTTASTAGNTTNLANVDGIGGATGGEALAAGVNAQAAGRSAVAVGQGAKADSLANIAIGENAQALTEDKNAVTANKDNQNGVNKAIAIGSGSRATNAKTIAIGDQAAASGLNANAIGSQANVSGREATGIGVAVSVAGDFATAIGQRANAAGANSTAVGNLALTSATARNSTAVGRDASVLNAHSNAVGAYNRVESQRATAIGYNNTLASTANGTYILGQTGGTATIPANAILHTDGNYYHPKTENGQIVADTTRPVVTGTQTTKIIRSADSVILGAGSDEVSANHTTVSERTLNGQSRLTSATAVDNATVGGIDYSGFAGDDKVVGIVSVGSANATRQIINVAPGEISATSTDAINGSQLYLTQEVIGNVAKSTATNLGGGSTVQSDGTITAPTYNIFTGNTTPNATGNSTTSVAGSPATTVGGAITALNTYINQGFNVKDHGGTTQGVVTPTESIQFINGENTTSKVTTEEAGITKVQYDVKIDGTTIINEGGVLKATATAPQTTDLTVTNGKVADPASPTNFVTAKEIADTINETSFTLTKANDKDGDENINAGDKLIVKDGTNTTATVDGNSLTFNVVADGRLVPSTTPSTTGGTPISTGKIEVPTGDENKLATTQTIADAINNAGFNLKTSATDGEKLTGTADNGELINPSDTVEMVAGKNLTVKQDQSGKVTFATAKEVEFDKVTVGNPDDNAITITSTPSTTGGTPTNTISNISNNLPDTFNANNPLNPTNAPVTKSHDLPNTLTPAQLNNAATVGDVLNAGFNVKNNGAERDFVKPYDTVNFVDGQGTKAVVTTDNDGKVSNVTYNVNADNTTTFVTAKNAAGDTIYLNPTDGKFYKEPNGVGGEETPVGDSVITAKSPVETGVINFNDGTGTTTNPANVATTAGKAEPKAGDVNKVATVGNVADAINASGFNLKTSATDGEKLTGTANDGELINPSDTVEMVAGKNLTVKQDQSGKVTFATADDVTFNSVTSNTVTIPANPATAGDKPITISNTGIDMGDKPITNVKAGAGTQVIDTKPQGNTGAPATATLTDLAGSTPTNAMTVADAQNMGFVVSAKGNEYKDAVKNANEVEFVGTGAAKVTGTTDGNKRTITVNVDPATVENTQLVVNADGKVDEPSTTAASPTDTPDANKYVNAGDLADTLNKTGFKVADSTGDKEHLVNAGDKVTFDNGTGTTATVTTTDTGTVVKYDVNKADAPVITNTGKVEAPTTGNTDGNNTFLTTNQVIDAINNAGFNLKTSATDGEKLTGTADNGELINPSDTVEMVAGKNLTVKQDQSGKVTFATAKEVEFDKVTVGNPDDNAITITSTPSTTGGTPTNTISNISNNLPDTFNANNPLNPTNAPVTKSHDLPNTLTPAQLNNAATVGDVLNAGFNVKNNGAERDFVKPYDTVNFVDGQGTKAVVTTDNDGKVSNVTYNVNADNTTTFVTAKNAAGDTIYLNPTDGKFYKEPNGVGGEETPVGDSVITAKSPVETGVINFNDGTGTTTNPANVATTAGKAEPKAGDVNKVATVGNVADAINASGFNLKTSATDGEKLTGTANDGELINPSDTVEMVAGKNLTVKQDQSGKVTFATADDVTFNSVTSNTVTIPANPATAGDKPITISNTGIDMGDKPITNVKAGAGTQVIDTKPQGNTGAPATATLTDLAGSTPTNAMTVADAQNMGFVVSAKGNEYKDAVKNANEVEFVGTGAAKVTGTTDGNKRTITVNVDPATVENTQLVVNADGKVDEPSTTAASPTDTPDANKYVNAGDLADTLNKTGFKVADSTGDKEHLVNAGDKVTFDNGTGTTATVTTTDTGTVVKYDVNKADAPVITNTGKVEAPTTGNTDGNNTFLTTNQVIDAINNAGFNLKTSATDGEKLTGTADNGELINPSDTVEMVAGKNLTVKQDQSGKVTFATAKEVEFDKVTVGNPDDNAITITSTPSTTGGTPTNTISNISNNLPDTFNANNPLNPTNAPVTKSHDLPNTLTPAQLNNAATVGDVLNAGFNVKNNGAERDFVKPYDTVNFVDGQGTKAVVTTDNDGKVSNVTYNVNADNTTTFVTAKNAAGDTIYLNPTDGKFYKEPNGVGGEETPVGDSVITAKSPVETGVINFNDGTGTTTNPANVATTAGKAEPKAGDVNKVATVGNVADAINASGFNLKTSATDGEKLTGTANDGELINPSDTVEMVAGKNLTVKQDQSGKVTFATADDVTFNSVTSNTVTIPANPATAGDKPITISNTGIDMGDKPITNVKAGAGTQVIDTKPQGNTGAPATATLTDLAGSTPTNAMTVADAQNMGFVVSAKGNEYKDAVKNANEVEFVGTGAAKVTGTTDGNKRTITVNVDPATVENTQLVVNADGKVDEPSTTAASPTDTPDANKYVNAGDLADTLNKTGFKVADSTGDKEHLVNAGDKVTFDNGTGTTATVTTTDTGTVVKYDVNKADAPVITNTGKVEAPTTGNTDGNNTFLTTNQVIDAINNAGFNLKTSATDGEKLTGTADNGELINPSDTVEMVAGKNLTVKQDQSGKVTFATAKEVEFDKVTVGNPDDNAITITSTPSTTGGTPTNTISNISNNLPDTFNANNPLNPTNAPVTKSHDLPNTLTPAQLNNAATVGDVLNAGFNVKNNGAERDFVKPYDTVNFVDGQGTKAVVTTDNDGKVSNVTYNVNADNTTTFVTAKNAAGDTIYLNPTDGKFYKEPNGVGGEETPVGDSVITAKSPVETGVINFNDGTGTTTNPANVATTAGKAEPKAGDVNKVATVGNVADAINASGFNLKTSATDGEKLTGTANDGELINPSDTVEMVAGKNLTVKQDQSGKVTFATADDVTFNSVTSNTVTIPANPATAGDKPITISNTGIDMGDKPITNVKAGAGTQVIDTKPQGNTGAPATATLTDLAGSTPTNAMTVADAQNMGFVVSAKGNEYKDAVKNANEVEFVGTGAAKVTGTTDGNKRTITVNVDPATVENTQLVVNADGKVDEPSTTAASPTDTPDANKYVNAGDLADTLNKTGFKVADSTGDKEHLVNAGDKVTFDNGTGTTATVTTTDTGTVVKYDVNKADAPVITNTGKVEAPTTGNTDGNNTFLTTNQVIDAINNAGFNLKTSATDGEKLTGTADNGELINPSDTVEMVAGKNLTVKQDQSGKVTFATAKEVEFDKVTVGNPDDNAITITSTPSTTGGTPTNTISNISNNLPDTFNANNPLNPTNAPVTKSHDLPNTLTPAQLNNAATVGDVLNAGFNVKNNGAERDFVKPYDTVNFVDGQGTKAVVTTDNDGKVSNVTYNVNADNTTTFVTAKNAAGDTIYLNPTDGKFYKEPNGVGGEETPVGDSVITAKSPVETGVINFNDGTGTTTNPANVATTAGKAEPKAGDVNKVATVGNVADAINASGFNLKTSATDGEKLTGTANDGELINPSDTVEMVAGKNLTVKQDQSGKVTFATADDVTFNSVTSNTVTIPANPATAGDKPITISNTGIDMGDKPITNVKAGAGTQVIDTKPQGNTGAPATATLTDLAGSTPTNAMTVADAQNMGFVVSAKGNEYKDAVKNANEVEFVGTGAAKVTGTTDGNKRTITVNVDPATVENTQLVVNADGKVDEPSTTAASPTDTPDANKYVNAGDLADTLNKTGFKVADSTGDKEHLVNAGDKVTFDNGTGTTATVTTTDTGTVVKYDVNKADAPVITNTGKVEAPTTGNTDGNNTFLTTNQVIDAINNAGFNLKTSATDGEKLTGTADNGELINPSDTVEMVAGKNLTVKQDQSGKVTFATADDVTFNSVFTNTITIPVIGGGNVVINENGINAGDKPITNVGKGTNPTDAANVGQLTKVVQGDGIKVTSAPNSEGGTTYTVEATAVPKDVKTGTVTVAPTGIATGSGNTDQHLTTADTVAKAINDSGFKVAGNGVANTDLVNPGDTVNFKDGNNTKAVVNPDNSVTFNVVGMPVQYTTKDGNPVTKVGDNYYPVKEDGTPDLTQPIPAGDIVANAINPTAKPNETGNAITLGNIASNLPDTFSTTNDLNNPSKLAPTTEAKLPTTLTTQQLNNAATVGDVLNAGWNLRTADKGALDFVKPFDTVEFVSGKGTTVVSSTDGQVSKVQYDANYENLTIKVGDTEYKVSGDVNTGYTFNLPNTGNNTGTGTTGGIAGGDTLADAKPVTSSTIINGQGTKVHVETATDPNDPTKSTTVLQVDAPVGYVNANANDTSSPTNVVTMIGKDDNKPVTVTNVATGSNIDIPKKEEGDSLTPTEVQNIRDAINNATGDQLNNAVNVGDLKALLGNTETIKTYDAASNIERHTIDPSVAISNMNKEGIRFFHTNSEEKASGDETARNPVDSSAKGQHATAIGYQAQAAGNQSVALGNSMFVGGEKFTATELNPANIDISESQANANSAYLTTYTNTKEGKQFTVQTTMARGEQSVAMGNGSQALGDKSIAIGTGNVVTGKGSGAIGDPSIVNADGSYSVGNDNTVTVEGKNSFILGNNVNMNIANSVALGDKTAVTASNTTTTAGTTEVKTATVVGNNVTMTYGDFAGNTPVGVVSVGSEGSERRIQNVAAGKIAEGSTDAINGSQLYAVAKGLQEAMPVVESKDQSVTITPTTDANGKTTYDLSVTAPNVDLTPLQQRITKVEGDANAGVSSAMAMAALPQAYLPGKSMLTGGMATYNGEGAVAVGLSKLSDNGRWVFKASGTADTQGNVGAAVGAGFHF